MAKKHAAVFVLDCSPSMNTPFPGSDNGGDDKAGTRLSCCKQAVCSMLTHLMLQSKQNVALVLVCRTQKSSDPEEEIPETHVTKLTKELVPPTLDLIEAVQRIETASATPDEIEIERGEDLDEGIALGILKACERLKNRPGQYQRKVVVLTDAEQEIALEASKMNQTIDDLRRLTVRLQVIGLNFTLSGVHDEPTHAVKQEQDANDAQKCPVRSSELGEDDGVEEEDVDLDVVSKSQGWVLVAGLITAQQDHSNAFDSLSFLDFS